MPAAGVVIVVLVAVAAAFPGVLPPAGELRPLLVGAAAVGGLALAVAGALSWRASGRAAPLWLSAAAVAYILWQLEALGFLGTAAVQTTPPVRLAPAAGTVLWIALIAAALWPTVDSGLRPWRMLVGAGIGVLVLTLALGIDFAEVLPVSDAVAAEWATLRASLAGWLPSVWAVPVLASAVQGHRRRDPVLGWATLLALALGGAEMLRSVTVGSDLLLAAGLGHTAAVLATAGGLGMSTAGLTSGHRREVGAATEASRTAQERLRAADAARAELVHEVQNALSTVDAGVSTLQASREQLSEDDRAELSEAVRATIDRLRLLLDDADDGPLHPVCLAEVLTPVARSYRARGQTVEVAVADDVWVLARHQSLAHVVGVLLDNAAKHAPGSTVRLTATGQQQGVVLRCADDGPGIPVAERDHVFLPGRRGQGATDDGHGFGLAIAARLVHEQGGTIWVEGRHGEGTVFAVWLARPEPDAVQDATTACGSAASGGCDG